MASIDWPSTLYGTILKDGVQETPPDNIIRTDMEVGPPKVRRRGTAAVRKFTFQMFLSGTLLAIFDTFYVTTSKSGSLAFNFRSLRTQVIGEYQFAAVPIYIPSEQGYLISCQLELLP